MSERKFVELLRCGVPPAAWPGASGILVINREVMEDVLKRYEHVPFHEVGIKVKVTVDGEEITYTSPEDIITFIMVSILEPERGG